MGSGQEGLVPMEEGRVLTVEEVKSQVEMIQRLMSSLMKEGEHYGKIPGCGDKPSLLKPGAEKLGFTFRVRPEFEIATHDFPGGHREEKIICRLYSMRTGQKVGEGLGTCSTMEGKYRYRWDNTGNLVPGEYWQSRDVSLLGGPSFTTRKTWVDNKQVWHIFQRVEHDNPADYYNTVLKMGKKRAHVDAIITYTAASDIFTQDLEDLQENGVIAKEEKPKPEPPKAKAEPPKAKTPVDKDKQPTPGLINAQQFKAISNLCDRLKVTVEGQGDKTLSGFLVVAQVTKEPKSLPDLTAQEAGEAISALQHYADEITKDGQVQ